MKKIITLSLTLITLGSCNPEPIDNKIDVTIDFAQAHPETIIKFSDGDHSVYFLQSDGVIQTKKVRESFTEVTYSIVNGVNNSCFYYLIPASEEWDMRLQASGGDSTAVHAVEAGYYFYENCR